MGIPYLILSADEKEISSQIEECYAYIKKNNTPFALIVRKDTFSPYSFATSTDDDASSDEAFVSTTGMASRELYELREKLNMSHERDFLTVGSMGHASSLALAMAEQRPLLPVTCIDGDGAALTHLGSMAAIGTRKPANLRHIVLNNGAHDSVGGQPTIAREIDLAGIARCAGYRQVFSVKNQEELRQALNPTASGKKDRPLFIEVLVCKGSRKDLGRPSSSPQENKEAFMRFISGGSI
jgi:phosphonopyruvate decarboxylase